MVRGMWPAILLGGAGCAGAVTAVDPAAPRVVYWESTDPDTVRQQSVYEGFGGAVLGFVRVEKRRDVAFVYLHGIQSHAGWFDAPAHMLCARGRDVYCLDRRGSGINRENRGFASGDVERYEILLKDVRAFVAPLRERYRQVFLIGLSWGGKLATAYALAHPEDLDGLVLITPGLTAKVDLAPSEKIEVVFDAALRPSGAIPIPIEPRMLTRTPEFLARIERDPLCLREATARFFVQSLNMDMYVEREIARNQVPILLFLAGQDQIIDNAAVLELLRRGVAQPEVRLYEDQVHSMQFDAPERLVADIERWLAERR